MPATHKLSQRREYRIWLAMRRRCHHQHNYPSYAITDPLELDPRWEISFENFIADMGPCPPNKTSIDRIENADGTYGPGKCRWADRFEQNQNKSNNRYLEFAGERLVVSEWARRLDIHVQTILWRLRNGRSVEQALSHIRNPGAGIRDRLRDPETGRLLPGKKS